jgi:histone arginine demethylase JMJD6
MPSAATGAPARPAARYPEIDRRSGLTPAEFRHEYLYRRRPVVITDAMDRWKARTLWTFDYFRTRYGDTPVTVYRLDGAKYQPDGIRQMKLADFIGEVSQHDFSTFPCYVRDDWRLFRAHPELLGDYAVPEYFFDWFSLVPSFMRLVYPRIFIGPRGAVTPLHLDIWGTHAWLGQLVGRKRWILFPPDQRELLYDCAVSVLNPDLERFPRFAQTAPVECTIGPGDLVFVPGGWAHEVVSLEASISISHNYMGPGCFRSSLAGSTKTQVIDRLARRRAA